MLGVAGAVGSLATQLLNGRIKAFVISTGSRPASKEWCGGMGADFAVDHTGDVIAQLPHYAEHGSH